MFVFTHARIVLVSRLTADLEESIFTPQNHFVAHIHIRAHLHVVSDGNALLSLYCVYIYREKLDS